MPLPPDIVKARDDILSRAKVSQTLLTGGDEAHRILILFRGQSIYDSGWVSIANPLPFVYLFPLEKKQGFVCFYLHRFVDKVGTIRYSRQKLPFELKPTNHRRKVQLVVSKRVHLPKLRQKSRSRVRRSVKQLRGFRVGGSSTRPNPEVQQVALRNWRVNTNGLVLTNTISLTDTYRRSWSGVRTPNFGKLKKRALPVNPHSVDLIIAQPQSCFYSEIRVTDGFGSYWIQIPGDAISVDLPGDPGFDSGVANSAIQKVIKRSERGIDGNLAQDIAQANRTVDVIFDSATRMANAAKNARRGDIPGVIDVLWKSSSPKFEKGREPKRGKSLASNWLAFQYGWKPLLNDIDGAVKALAKYHTDTRGSVRQVTASASKRVVEYQDILRHGGRSKIGTIQRIKTYNTRIGLRYAIDNRLHSFLGQTGFTNPVNLVWELLPYSFVVDWFLPIGPYLETLSAWGGLTFVDGFQTDFGRQVTSASTNWSGFDVASPTLREEWYGTYSGMRIRMRRSRLTSFPTMSLPTLKNPFSVDHALNAIALMRSAF
jgi:hypothetical protein